VIATRACIYWVLAAGLNLLVGFAGQLAIGWVALLTLGAYTTACSRRQRAAGAAPLSGARDRGVVGASSG
jgi:ABC-type branched-subunit amino acid transport system permease subunit